MGARAMSERLAARLRTTFRKYGFVFGMAWWFAGVGAMSSDKYLFAFIFYVIGGVLLLGWWLTENPTPRKKNKQNQWTKKQKKQSRRRWLGALVAVAITAGMCAWTQQIKIDHELKQYAGPLYAGWKPTPPDPCGNVSGNSLAIFMGKNASHANKFPHTVLQMNEDKLLVLNRDNNGHLFVLFRILD